MDWIFTDCNLPQITAPKNSYAYQTVVINLECRHTWIHVDGIQNNTEKTLKLVMERKQGIAQHQPLKQHKPVATT